MQILFFSENLYLCCVEGEGEQISNTSCHTSCCKLHQQTIGLLIRNLETQTVDNNTAVISCTSNPLVCLLGT